MILWEGCGGAVISLSGGLATDHPPRHIHVSDGNGNLLGRIGLANFEPLDDWKPPRKVIDIIQQLIAKDRL